MSTMFIPRAIPFCAPQYTGLNHVDIADFVGSRKLHTEIIENEEKLFLVDGEIGTISIEIRVGDFLVKNYDDSISVYNPEDFYNLFEEYNNV